MGLRFSCRAIWATACWEVAESPWALRLRSWAQRALARAGFCLTDSSSWDWAWAPGANGLAAKTSAAATQASCPAWGRDFTIDNQLLPFQFAGMGDREGAGSVCGAALGPLDPAAQGGEVKGWGCPAGEAALQPAHLHQ